MLKKVIATVISVTFAVLTIGSMTLSAFADDSVVTTTANIEVVEEAADAEEFAEASTTTTEATDAAFVETTDRNLGKSNVSVRDIIYFDDGVVLTTAEGNTMRTGCGEHVYIVNDDSENARFRAYVPKSNRVLYLSYEDSYNAVVDSYDGFVIGDLDDDGSIDARDLGLMKYGLLYGWSDAISYYMSDFDGDGMVKMNDLVSMELWLLGEG